MNNGNVFQQLIAATFPVGGYQMHWLELIGILIGAASAYLGMKRWVWAWPVSYTHLDVYKRQVLRW